MTSYRFVAALLICSIALLAGCLTDGNANVNTCSDGTTYSSEMERCVSDAADAGGDDTTSDDTGRDTSSTDTGLEDTSDPVDTGVEDTSDPVDTGPQCTAPEMACGATCVDVQTSPDHCGDCNQPCTAPRACQSGQCQCADGKTFCNGACVDTTSNALHCGGCGNACQGGYVCGESSCHQNEKIAGVLAAVNQARSTDSNCGAYGDFSAVGSVSGDENLHQAAQGHADDMANNDFFDHVGSDGSSFSKRMRDAGYTGWPVGENIAAGGTDPGSVVQRWMDSDGHCRNIMNGSANEIGVGFARNPSSRWGTYWVLKLGQQ